jgi:hypothetical protein
MIRANLILLLPGLILGVMIPGFVFAQRETQWEPDFSNYLEAISDPGLEEITDEVYESLVQWYRNPINLNTATRDDLLALLLLDEQEILEILFYRQQYGRFISFQELYLIEGLDSIKIAAVKDFLIIGPGSLTGQDTIPFLRRITRFAKSSLIIRYSRLIEKSQGYRNRNDPLAFGEKKYYFGSPDHLNLRFNLEIPGDFLVGLRAEKDPGEKIYFAPESYGYGFDHYAGYIRKQYKTCVKSITVGDYQLQAGQGVVMGNGLFVGKGSEPIRTTIRHDDGVRPYQGSTEYGFFRGLAMDLGRKQWSATAFVSRKGLDATVEKTADPDTPGVIRSLGRTGYHRTPVELSRKNAAFMHTAGVKGSYHTRYHNFSLGISGIWNRLNLPLHESPNYYNTFDFSGKDHYNMGLNYNYYRGKFNVFGEVALCRMGGIGIVQGIIASLGSSVEAVIHFRHYDKQYFSFTGRAFGEYSVNSNEQGFYWGFKIFPLPGLTLNFYFDLFRSDWLRYRSAAPGTGNEWMMSAKYSTGKFSNLEIYLKQENKPRNISVGYNHEYILSGGTGSKARLTYRYDVPEGLILTSRIQGARHVAGSTKSTGFALVQDAGHRFSRGYVKARIAWFRANDFETRQYVYEADVLFSYSAPVYYGNGLRYMVLFKFSPWKTVDFWLKMGQYIYFGQDFVGSGLDELSGNKKTDLRCQIRYKF